MPVTITDKEKELKFKAFAAALGKSEEEVIAALKAELGDTITDATVDNLGNPEITPDVDLLAALVAVGVPKATARAAIKGMRNAPVKAPVTESVPAPAHAAVLGTSNLLATPADSVSLLERLRTGGVAKMTPDDLVAAVRGTYTRMLGVGMIIPKLLEACKAHHLKLEEPLPPAYYKLLKAHRRRSYAEILAAFEGAITSVPESDKEALMGRIEILFASVLPGFAKQLDAYRETHVQDSNNGNNLVAALRSGITGIEYPDVSPVLTAVRGVIDRFNRAFAGDGIPCARAIAQDLTDEVDILRDPNLPNLIGAGSFEEMIKKLELSVPADVSQQEQLIAKFVFNVLKLPDQTPDTQPEFILQLQRLAKSIVWPTSSKASTSRGSASARSEDDAFGRRGTRT